jgi:hypothetical protein
MSEGLGAGTMLGAYRIEGELGGGGMGTVYEAVEPTIGKRVAIKVLRSAFAEDAEQVGRFEREARAANEVRHPAIVDVFAFGRLGDGRPYLVMSLLEGRSLRDELTSRGKLPAAEAWAIARDVADALSSAHAASVIHRDLKPDNVFLERLGDAPMRVRVLDFGIAKVQSQKDFERLTNTGVPLGTPSYMAPELWWGSDVDARVDQYALGAMLFELIAGHLPFSANGFMQLVQKHLHEAPPPLGASPPVDAFVARLLAKTPAERFASMREVVTAGDEAFGAERTPLRIPKTTTVPAAPESVEPLPAEAPASLRRYGVVHAAAIVTPLAIVSAVGYAGAERYQVREWFKMSGFPAWPCLLAFLAAAVWLPVIGARRARTGVPATFAWWLALLPGLVGAGGAWLGWNQVVKYLGQLTLTKRFAVLNQGMYEVNALRFLGLSLSLALLLAASAIPALSGNATSATLVAGHGVRRRESIAFLLGLLALAAAALFAHAPSGVLVATTAAIALAIGLALPPLHPITAARDELERALASTLAVAIATSIAFARIEAREAALWSEQTRAARVTEILAASAERKATTAIALGCIVAVVVLEIVRVRRLWRRAGMRTPSTPTFVLAILVLTAVGFDVVLHGRFEEARDTLWRTLEKPFALFARLDPPSAAGLDRERFATHRAPTLQITRDVIAIDAAAVAPIAALDSPEGTINVAGAIGKAIAQNASDPQPGDRDLAIAIDREVRWRTVALLLGIAHRSGARRIELRFTRGPRPEIPTSGPPEIGYVLPSDFVAVEAVLGNVGLSANPDLSFLEVAPQIVGAAANGPVSLAVGP